MCRFAVGLFFVIHGLEHLRAGDGDEERAMVLGMKERAERSSARPFS
jgi:hypothetical protein